MLTGKLRRGSGITGSGGRAGVVPVINWLFCGSDALIWMLPRAFGAGFGIGTFCAKDEVTVPATYAAISNAKAARMPGTPDCFAIRDFGFLFNSSCLGCRPFYSALVKGDIVFPLKYNAMTGTSLGRRRASKTTLFFFDQNFALSRVIGLSDNAFEFHPLHQRRSAIISDLEPALNIAGGRLAVAFDDRDCLREQVAATIATHAGGIEHRAVFVGGLLRGDRFEVFRGALRFEMSHHLLDLFVGNERSVDAADASAARHIEHVAL